MVSLLPPTGEGVFSELLKSLPEEEVLPCVTQSAREVFRVLKSYHKMMAWNEAEARKLMSEDVSPRNDTEDPEETWVSTTNGYLDDPCEIDGEDVMYILAALQRGRKVRTRAPELQLLLLLSSSSSSSSPSSLSDRFSTARAWTAGRLGSGIGKDAKLDWRGSAGSNWQ